MPTGGRKWSEQQHRAFKKRMKSLKDAGKSAWSASRLAKFRASMAARNGTKKNGKANGHANGKVQSDMQMIPLDMIPERVKKKYAPKPQRTHGLVDISAKQQLAMATLAVLKQILDS